MGAHCWNFWWNRCKDLHQWRTWQHFKWSRSSPSGRPRPQAGRNTNIFLWWLYWRGSTAGHSYICFQSWCSDKWGLLWSIIRYWVGWTAQWWWNYCWLYRLDLCGRRWKCLSGSCCRGELPGNCRILRHSLAGWCRTRRYWNWLVYNQRPDNYTWNKWSWGIRGGWRRYSICIFWFNPVLG